MGGSIDEMLENKEDNKQLEKDKDDVDGQHGPGYMGWNVPDESEKVVDEKYFKTEIAELKEAYRALRKEFEEIKLEVSKNDKKQITKLKVEINGLKDGYKQCIEDLKKETHARNAAETVAKVLKDTLEAKEKLEEIKDNDEMEIEEQSAEKEVDDGQWKQQRKQRKKNMKRSRQKSESQSEEEDFSCDHCQRMVESITALDEHKKSHAVFVFNQCDYKSSNKN